MKAVETRRIAKGGRSGALSQHPVFAIICLGVLCIAMISMRSLGLDQLLARGWSMTLALTAVILGSMTYVVPRWFPQANHYLWSVPGGGVSVRFSVSVALVAYSLALVAVLVLSIVGQFHYNDMTAHWSSLWLIVGASAILPIVVGMYVGLDQSGAVRRLRWLNIAQLIMDTTTRQFNDAGRIFILLVLAVTIGAIQGGIVLTGGVAMSFFTVLLVSVGSAAALASERPAYAVFAVVQGWSAAAVIEHTGSYAPLGTSYYPVAHFSMLTLTLFVGLLIDLGRRRRTRDAKAAEGISMRKPRRSPSTASVPRPSQSDSGEP